MLRLLATVMCWILLTAPAQAISTGEMLRACQQVHHQMEMVGPENIFVPRSYEGGLCFGGFEALHALTRAVRNGSPDPVLKVCKPKGVQLLQMISVFIHYAQQRPAQHHEEWLFMALDALQKAFPCET